MLLDRQKLKLFALKFPQMRFLLRCRLFSLVHHTVALLQYFLDLKFLVGMIIGFVLIGWESKSEFVLQSVLGIIEI